MKKFDLIILMTLMISVNSFASVLSTSNPAQKTFFESCLADPNGPCSRPGSDVLQNLIKEADDEIDHEASVAGKSRDEYLASDAAFTVLLTAMQSDEFKKMDRADLTISIVKMGVRYRAIQSTRFVAPHFFENEQTFLRLMREVSAQHHLPFQL